MTSVMLNELFPDVPDAIYPVRKGCTRSAVMPTAGAEKVDLSMIQPNHTVNILASHHGFTLLGGEPYAELLKTVYDVVKDGQELGKSVCVQEWGCAFGRRRNTLSVLG